MRKFEREEEDDQRFKVECCQLDLNVLVRTKLSSPIK